jgi:hypothetical protein
MTIVEKSDEGPVENKVLDCKFVVLDFVEDSSGMHRFVCSKMPLPSAEMTSAAPAVTSIIVRVA